ncbi:tail fiber assembly protein [Salmonella enterica]
MTFHMSEEEQTIKVFNLRADTNEFIGESDAYIPPHTGLPANCTDIAPPEIPDGYAAIFDSDECGWHLVEDHRGKTVYEKETGTSVYISELGSLPLNVTAISPSGHYQKWNGEAWVNDADAEREALISEAESQKKDLLKQASEIITTLQDAVDLDMATDDEKILLNQWKKYRILLSRVQPINAPNIQWPEVVE